MMKSSPEAPTFNLKAVVQETGLKPDTLRAWERRYGLPVPQRTESGHRLYSQKDIQLLKWLIKRQEEGMSISRAVELWRRLEADAETASQPPLAPASQPVNHIARPLPDYHSYAAQAIDVPIPSYVAGQRPESISSASGEILARAREEWVMACLNFDEQQAERVISQAFGLFSVEQVCIELIQKGLSMIGERWYTGEVTVQQEHFASALASRRLEALIAATATPTRPGRILVGCPPEEIHTLPPLLLSLLLRRRGWDILFLGANIPVEDFIATTRRTRPNLVILIAQQLFTAASLRELGELIHQEGIPMAFGGMIFNQLPELPERVTGHYLGSSIEGAIQQVEGLLASGKLPETAVALPAAYVKTLEQYRLHQASIEAELWRSQIWHRLGISRIHHTLLHKANSNFSRTVIAALLLGDIDYVSPDLHWVQGLLSNHYQTSAALITQYLTAYLEAARSQIQDQGNVLIDWLTRTLAQTG